MSTNPDNQAGHPSRDWIPPKSQFLHGNGKDQRRLPSKPAPGPGPAFSHVAANAAGLPAAQGNSPSLRRRPESQPMFSSVRAMSGHVPAAGLEPATTPSDPTGDAYELGRSSGSSITALGSLQDEGRSRPQPVPSDHRSPRSYQDHPPLLSHQAPLPNSGPFPSHQTNLPDARPIHPDQAGLPDLQSMPFSQPQTQTADPTVAPALVNSRNTPPLAASLRQPSPRDPVYGGTPLSGSQIAARRLFAGPPRTPDRPTQAIVDTPPGQKAGYVGIPGAFSSTPQTVRLNRHQHPASAMEADLPPSSVSKLMHNFDLNAVLRGAQLTVVGFFRAIQNEKLFQSKYAQQLALAVLAGLAVQLAVAVPVQLVRFAMFLLSLVFDFEDTLWDDRVAGGLEFIEHSVLRVPFVFVSLIQAVNPAFDDLFMDSLAWVDATTVAKHQGERLGDRVEYHARLKEYELKRRELQRLERATVNQRILFAFGDFAGKAARRGFISLVVYGATFVPIFGRYVLPAASFYTFRKAVGTPPAVAIFAVGVVMPKSWLVSFLQAYFASRTMVRQLLQPYFKRVSFSSAQQRFWFKERAGVLFGFSLPFYAMLKIPVVGVLVYGIAQASTAYLVTKITEPPPRLAENVIDKAELQEYLDKSVEWKNKKQFLAGPIWELRAKKQRETSADRPTEKVVYQSRPIDAPFGFQPSVTAEKIPASYGDPMEEDTHLESDDLGRSQLEGIVPPGSTGNTPGVSGRNSMLSSSFS